MKKSDKFIFGTIVGGAIGSVLGLLLAPKAGKETREEIADVSKKAFKWGKKHANKLGAEHKDEVDEALEKLQHSAKKIHRSFLALRKRTVRPAIKKLADSRDNESGKK